MTPSRLDIAPPALQPTETTRLQSPGRASRLCRRKRSAVLRSTSDHGDLPQRTPSASPLSRPRQPQVTYTMPRSRYFAAPSRESPSRVCGICKYPAALFSKTTGAVAAVNRPHVPAGSTLPSAVRYGSGA